MGLFAALGSLFGPVGTVIGSGLDAKVSYDRQKKQNAALQRQYEQQRAQDKLDASNKFVDMSAAAKKAGFNPLTALRLTGAAGYGRYGGQIPVMSSAGFTTHLYNAAGDAYQMWQNKTTQEKLDKYNEEIRGLTIEETRARIENTRANTAYTGILANEALNPNDPYAGYKEFIPVKVGLNTQYLQIDVAKRLGVLPNTPLTAGDIEEIKGEVHGGIDAAVQSKIGTEVLRPAPIFGNSTNIETVELPPLGESNFDRFLRTTVLPILTPPSGNLSGRNAARIQ